MDSKKLRILKALTAHLEFINPTNEDPRWAANGEAPRPYPIDLRDQVFRGRIEFGQDEAVENPVIAILEAPKPIDPLAAGEGRRVRKSTWPLLVQGFVPKDRFNPTDPAHDLCAMIEMRLMRIGQINSDTGDGQFPGEYMLDGLIDSLAISEGIVRPSDPQVSPTAFFYLPVAVGLVTDLGNPYAD